MLPHFAESLSISLRCCQYEGHFRRLRDLYNKNELTSAINRVMADINYWFTLEVLAQGIDVLHLPDVSWKSGRTVFAQPSLR